MGFLSGLFGGGSSQTVTTTQDINVEVGINNEINVESLANVLESIKNIFAKSEAEKTQLEVITAAVLAKQAKAEQDQAAALGSLTKVSKIALLAGGGYMIWRHKKKKRRKK